MTNKQHFISVNGELIPVNEDVYQEYYRPIWRTHYHACKHGQCGCTDWRRCEGDCGLCRYRAAGNTLSLDAEYEGEEGSKLTLLDVAEMVKVCVKENASSALSQEEYTKKYSSLVKRYEKTASRLDTLSAERTRKQDRDRELRLFIEAIKQQPLVLEVWNEGLWVGLLEKATVFHGGRMMFQFKNGTEIEVEL